MKSDRRAWLLWWGGAALVPASGALMVLAARHCTGFWPTDVITHLRCFGTVPTLMWGMWLTAFACMTFGMLGLERASLRNVVLAQAAAGVLFVLTPTMPTADAYEYHVYGAMLGHSSPWQIAGAVVSDRPAIATGLKIWGNPPAPSPYGPLFVLYQHVLLGALPKSSADELIYVERSLSLLAALAITRLLPGARVAWWGLHPLVLFEFALGAHCDVFMLLLTALSLRLRSPILAGIAIGCAAMVKVVGFGASAFRIATIPSALATVVAILAIFPSAATLAPARLAAAGFSGSPAYVLAFIAHAAHLPKPDFLSRAAVVVAAALAAIALRTGGRDRALYGTLLLVLCSTWIVPWYLTWVVFASRFAHRPAAVAAAVIASASIVLEAKNEVTTQSELLQALFFLIVVAWALRWAWSHGDRLDVAPWLRGRSRAAGANA